MTQNALKTTDFSEAYTLASKSPNQVVTFNGQTPGGLSVTQQIVRVTDDASKTQHLTDMSQGADGKIALKSSANKGTFITKTFG